MFVFEAAGRGGMSGSATARGLAGSDPTGRVIQRRREADGAEFAVNRRCVEGERELWAEMRLKVGRSIGGGLVTPPRRVGRRECARGGQGAELAKRARIERDLGAEERGGDQQQGIKGQLGEGPGDFG